jgi:hypothetical protein
MVLGNLTYSLLLFIVLGAGVLLASFTWATRADTPCGIDGNLKPSEAECNSSYTIYASVAGPRPTVPAIITSPKTGASFNTNPVTVEGTCPDKDMVKVFTNGILVGAVLCNKGHFSVPVDLVIGKNDLTALPFNALDEQGPTGNTVTVTLNEPAGGPGFSTQMLLQSVNYYRGIEVGQTVTWPIEIVGGQAPYAISIDWGDGTQDVITRLTAGPFTVTHKYTKPGKGYLGSYPLIIRGSDAAGHTAYLQLTTIVNTTASSTSAGGKGTTTNLLVIWPLWIVLLLMVISFWLGERREKRLMERRLAALA